MAKDNWHGLGDIRALERKAAEASKNEAATIAYMALKVANDLKYLNGCVARGRGNDIDLAQPGRNVFEYIKELEGKSNNWLEEIGEEIHANKLRHGWKVTTVDDWKDPHEIPAVLALIHSEVSEALEAFRKSDFDNFREELADVAIRLIGLSHGMGIDLKAEISAKVEKNRTREYRHGGKRV